LLLKIFALDFKQFMVCMHIQGQIISSLEIHILWQITKSYILSAKSTPIIYRRSKALRYFSLFVISNTVDLLIILVEDIQESLLR
jgi:hypothetical protein